MYFSRGWSFYLQFSLLLVGVLISLVSGNPLGVWVGVELNMFSILPYLMRFGSTSLTYFVVQSIGTVGFLMALLNPNKPSVLMISLLLKLGVFPLYSWYLNMINESPWWLIWIMSTVQKMHLLCLMSGILVMSTTPTMMMGVMSGVMVSGHLLKMLGGNLSKMSALNKIVVGLLSILDTSLLMVVFMWWPWGGFIYFLGYTMFLMGLVKWLNLNFWSTGALLGFILSSLNLSGFPPTPGFFVKMKLMGGMSEIPMELNPLSFNLLSMFLILGLLCILLTQFIGYLVILLSKLNPLTTMNLLSPQTLSVVLIGWLGCLVLFFS